MKTEMDQEFPARLRKVVDDAGGPRLVARLTGINERSLMNYLAGDHLPKADALGRLAEATKCDMVWLLTGNRVAMAEVKEPPRPAEPAVDAELMARIVDGFMKLYKELSITTVPAELGRKYAEVYAEIASATEDQDERFAMVKLAVAQHRKALLAPPSAGTAGKQRA